MNPAASVPQVQPPHPGNDNTFPQHDSSLIIPEEPIYEDVPQEDVLTLTTTKNVAYVQTGRIV